MVTSTLKKWGLLATPWVGAVGVNMALLLLLPLLQQQSWEPRPLTPQYQVNWQRTTQARQVLKPQQQQDQAPASQPDSVAEPQATPETPRQLLVPKALPAPTDLAALALSPDSGHPQALEPALDVAAMPQMEPPAEAFKASELDQGTQVLTRPPVQYPWRAQQAGVEGQVRVRLLVDKQGHVKQVAILEAKPEGYFEKAVRQGVKQWRFQPGRIDGAKVKSWVETTIRFQLQR